MNQNFYSFAFSVDNIIFGFDAGRLKVLLIKRRDEPFKGKWALPGALVSNDEDLDEAAGRILEELTGINKVYLKQVYTFGKPDRHPKGRVITVAYFSLINVQKVKPIAASAAAEVAWHDVFNLEELPFDHNEIMNTSVENLQKNLRTRPIGFELLPLKFTLTDLQNLYEAVLNKTLDKRNFRKKLLAMKILKDIRESQKGVAHRPAKLYSFDREKYLSALSNGFNFEI